MIRKSVQRLSTYSHGGLAARLDEVAAAARGLYTKVLHSRGLAAPLVFHSSCILALLYDLVAGESKMDQADWKLRVFYQYQIAKIAKLARERPHPADRKRLNFMLDQYIDMLLVLPRPSERAKGVETRMLPTFVKRRRGRGRSPGIQSSPQSNRARTKSDPCGGVGAHLHRTGPGNPCASIPLSTRRAPARVCCLSGEGMMG
jgi:hypothetical protein